MIPTSSETDDPWDEILAGRRRRNRVRAFWSVGFLLVLIPLWAIYFWFAQVVNPDVAYDLWLNSAEGVRPGSVTLVDTSMRDPVSGEEVPGAEYELVIHHGTTVVRRERLRGMARTPVQAPMEGTLRVEASFADERIGAVTASREIRIEANPAELGEKRGGWVASAGLAGLSLVRGNDLCGLSARAIAASGVPIGGVLNEVFIELRGATGNPAPNLRILAGDSTTKVELRQSVTDASGIARLAFRPQDREYLEIRVPCDAGEALFGFEVQPTWDGINVTKVDHSPEGGVHAELESLRQRGVLWWDVRCDGNVLAWDQLSTRSTYISVPSVQFADVRLGAACRLMVYRDLFSAESGWSGRWFRWGDSTSSSEWASIVGGVRSDRSSPVRARVSSKGALDEWSAANLQQIRWTLWGLAVLYCLIWTMVCWVASRRPRSSVDDLRSENWRSGEYDPIRDAGELDEVQPDLVFSGGTLVAGWMAIGVLVGGFGFLLSLMGL